MKPIQKTDYMNRKKEEGDNENNAAHKVTLPFPQNPRIFLSPTPTHSCLCILSTFILSIFLFMPPPPPLLINVYFILALAEHNSPGPVKCHSTDYHHLNSKNFSQQAAGNCNIDAITSSQHLDPAARGSVREGWLHWTKVQQRLWWQEKTHLKNKNALWNETS